MAWIILEGLDRTGKSSVAEMYKKQGYHVVHMSAPDKKYMAAGYAGPSYLDDLLDIYMTCNARDIVFDRSPYGEMVWPFVYGRKCQLDDESIEVLRELEDSNSVTRILMYDPDVAAHWKRCVDNKEPLDKNQFNQANLFFDRMATKYDFERRTLKDFDKGLNFIAVELTEEQKKKQEEEMKNTVTITNASENVTTVTTTTELKELKSPEQLKLDKANAINDVLSKRIVKAKGQMYDEIEKEIRIFLNSKLGTIFGSGNAAGNFSNDEVEMLKLYCKQLKKKLESK